ncbi:MAG: GNAT family N-acetyltransferase [Chloroflexota bacterium]
MVSEIREDFSPVLVNETYRIESVERTKFWIATMPLMKTIFPNYADIGAYGFVISEERQLTARVLREFFDFSHHEYLLFKDIDDTVVGYAYGDMRDSQTFFMTSTGILSEHRRKGLYSGFVTYLLQYLSKIGYERVVSNHHPNNRAVIITKLKLGFNITAVNLDERWGAQVELTYLFDDDRRLAYERAFALEHRPMPTPHKISAP